MRARAHVFGTVGCLALVLIQAGGLIAEPGPGGRPGDTASLHIEEGPTPDQVVLTWAPTPDRGSEPLLGHRVLRRPVGTAEWEPRAGVPWPDTTYTDRAVPGVAFEYGVLGYSILGLGGLATATHTVPGYAPADMLTADAATLVACSTYPSPNHPTCRTHPGTGNLTMRDDLPVYVWATVGGGLFHGPAPVAGGLVGLMVRVQHGPPCGGEVCAHAVDEHTFDVSAVVDDAGTYEVRVGPVGVRAEDDASCTAVHVVVSATYDLLVADEAHPFIVC